MGPLVLQIVLAVVALVGLITILMSAKTWHWAQMLLVLGIFLFGITTLVFGLKVLQIHRAVKTTVEQQQEQLEGIEGQLLALEIGARDNKYIQMLFSGDPPFDQEEEGGMPSMAVWRHRLQVLSRSRGRVWRNVQKVGGVDPQTNQIQAALSDAGPAGIETGAIVYAFEMGDPDGSAPSNGSQYLGAFRVTATADRSLTLQSVYQLDQVTGNRLANSQRPWSLYETMPADRHELFAGMSEQQKQAWLPAASIDEYLRHGGQPAPDDDEFHVAYFNEAGERLGADEVEQTAAGDMEKRYDRPLHDYAYLFEELERQKAVLLARQLALRDDAAQLARANENAKLVTAFRQQEKADLSADLGQLTRELGVIREHLDRVTAQLSAAGQLLTQKLDENARLGAQLAVGQGS